MTKKEPKRIVFPFYLRPGPSKRILSWVGKQLQQTRGGVSLASVSQKIGMSIAQVRAIERGVFEVSLGRFREILWRGYDVSLSDLLAQCYEAHRELFDPQHVRNFERQGHYTFSLRGEVGKNPTPVLIGGDSESYLWAAPMRRLKETLI